MNIMVFCSNPVDGGTARIFYEFLNGLLNCSKKENNIFPCINDKAAYKSRDTVQSRIYILHNDMEKSLLKGT